MVESGINMFLHGMSIEEASEKMIAEYDANCSRITDPKVDDERNNLVPLLELGTKTFQEYAYRWTLLNYQKKVEVEIDGIPFLEDLPPELGGPLTNAVNQGIVTGPLSKASNLLG